jgi:hypothetical protein
MQANLRELLILRRAEVTLSPYLLKSEIKADQSIYIASTCEFKGRCYNINFKADRLLKKLTNELLRLEPAIIGGRVNVDDVKACIIGLYITASKLSKDRELRATIKKSLGLFKNKELRNKLKSNKIMSGRIRVQKVLKE